VPAPAEDPDEIDVVAVISAAGAALVVLIAVMVAILICWRPRKSSQSATTIVVDNPEGAQIEELICEEPDLPEDVCNG
jgi:hypothetical protein